LKPQKTHKGQQFLSKSRIREKIRIREKMEKITGREKGAVCRDRRQRRREIEERKKILSVTEIQEEG
jgi:hypothetical protein